MPVSAPRWLRHWQGLQLADMTRRRAPRQGVDGVCVHPVAGVRHVEIEAAGPRRRLVRRGGVGRGHVEEARVRAGVEVREQGLEHGGLEDRQDAEL